MSDHIDRAAEAIDSAARVVSPALSELWESNITNWGPEARDIVRALAGWPARHPRP